MRIALAQINPTVGDIESNRRRVLHDIETAADQGAELLVFPELAAFGYPPKDLLARRELIERNQAAVEDIASHCKELTVVVGYVQRDPSGSGTGLFNAAAVCRDGHIEKSYAKALLPTYDVFDETRYFNAGKQVQTFDLRADDGVHRVGLTICEDLWNDEQFEGRRVYGVDPVERAVAAGSQLIVNLSASPYEAVKAGFREAIFAQQAREHLVPVVFVNQVGGNDDLIFEGASCVLDQSGEVIARAKSFEEDLLVVNLESTARHRLEPLPSRIESVRQALVLGTRDYVAKCGFQAVVVGLSGGIDSAVTAAIAVEALGPERVHGVAMPSRHSSDHSVEDARQLAETLGIQFRIIPIEGPHKAMEEALAGAFAGTAPDVAEENLQARIRGTILMALSNKFGWLLLTTGNKSELAVGYCTLYGDMSGGLAVLSDVPKTTVYELARHINATSEHPKMPERSIDKPPSAELKADQRDTDSLPPYETLDAILERYIEKSEGIDEIVANGFDGKLVQRIARMVDISEHKRKQAPIGLKVTSKAFGTGRRFPIAAKHR
ncbi:MAG: NAD+ synthase [Phycisphaerales bacterium]|nr:MAG: NAD+ synthase [Phycisphaerales bacterium]